MQIGLLYYFAYLLVPHNMEASGEALCYMSYSAKNNV